MLTLHGIRNCDTVRKARALLDTLGVPCALRDYKQTPPSPQELAHWCATFGWGQVLNRNGTTFRKLPEPQREGLDEARAMALMLAHPSCIRRPILEGPGVALIGLDAQAWQQALVPARP